ncbi:MULTISPECIES: hypothetical protein [Metabacillus]|uniref:hypothetical protein n=1 Tax=Metabacillus TaxID=2675233 RepID=UPI000C80D8C8|nr:MULTISPECIES: hypothetical protein [Metabacillus]MCM3444010.1 hypothetical protein [Metabacillus halosaccharovorans]PMC34942.1 hypothetical protein CJ195_20760 [Bacillus sp. UMB0899]
MGYKNKATMKELRKKEKYLIKKLKSEGFVIQKYSSITTNSIYLKLDYGVSNSIRISDHKGKAHLSYKFNLLSCCPYNITSVTKDGFYRHYYPLDEIDEMIQAIVSSRNEKIHQYGEQSYKKWMQINFNENKDKKKGFWQSSVTV